MKKLKQYHFYYGAILNAIFEYNNDAVPTLLEVTDKRGVYKIITNTSKQEYIAFCKYAFQQDNRSITYRSWKFTFTDEDKKCLQKYYDDKYPVFIYFLCGNEGLKDCEIAMCSYEEYGVVKEKQTITVGRERSKSYFNLYTDKRRSSAIHLNRSRIEKKIDDIIDEVVNFSPEHYQSKVRKNIKINLSNTEINEPKKYPKAISGQTIRYVSLSYRDDNICPIHSTKMKPIFVHIGNVKDTVYYCSMCGKYMIPNKRYQYIINALGRDYKSIEFKTILENESHLR